MTMLLRKFVVATCALAGVGGQAASVHGEVWLPDPVFVEFATAAGESHEGGGSSAPEDLFVDHTVLLSGNRLVEAVARATGSTTGPMVDVQFNHAGPVVSNAGTSAGARVYYAFALSPRVADAPIVPVPVRTTVKAEVAVGGPSDVAHAYASMAAHVTVDVSQGPSPEYVINRLLEVAVGAAYQVDGRPAALSIEEQYLLHLTPGHLIGVTKDVSGGVGGEHFASGTTLHGQGVADPIFQIDPSFIVNYNGIDTPATDLYDIVYSPTIIPLNVPEPGCAAAIWAVAVIGLCRRRLQR